MRSGAAGGEELMLALEHLFYFFLKDLLKSKRADSHPVRQTRCFSFRFNRTTKSGFTKLYEYAVSLASLSLLSFTPGLITCVIIHEM